MSTTNSMSQQLEDVNRLNQNALNFFKAMYEAITTNKENASAIIELQDGTKETVVIPSNIFLKSEVERVRLSLDNLSGLSNSKSGTIVSVNDGNNETLRHIFLTTFKKAVDKIGANEVILKQNININQNPLIEKMLSPITTVNITLPNRFNSNKYVIVSKIFLSSLNGLNNGQSYSSVKQYLSSNNITFTETEDVIKTNPNKTRYYGTFDVLNIVDNSNDTFTCRLNKKTYSDIENTVENSRELDVNNKLVTKDGLTLFQIISVIDNGLGVYVTLKNISGQSGLVNGMQALSYYDDATNVKSVDVPIKGQDKFMMFISSLDDVSDTKGIYSDGIMVDSSSMKIVSNGIEYNFNTYFTSNILSLGNHLESLVKDNTVPRTLAELPSKPILDTKYFKVRQVNKHITNTANSEKLKSFSAEKNRLQSDIGKISTSISKLNDKINKGQYKSRDEKKQDDNTLTVLINRRDEKQVAYNSAVDNISSLSTFIDAPKSAPKYKIQGFWNIDEPTSSITGDKQRIVKYNIRYKYVPSNSDVSETPSINIDGKEGLISAWNETTTIPLNKTFDDVKKKFVWETVNIGDADVNNINQLEISISYGESVVIQVQAISEAGYPSNPQLSEWSEPIKVDFPNELAQDEQISSIVENNSKDLVKVEVNREFQSRGIPKHLSYSYTEQDRYFAYSSDEIASGLFTTEQKTISLSEYIKAQDLKIKQLEAIILRKNTSYSVELIAPNGRVYPVNKLSTINLFAGHYTDTVDVNVSNNYGNIVEVVFYLKLINNNATSTDITSLSSGILTQLTTNSNYNDVPFSLVGSELAQPQKNGQIIYLRNKDVSGSNDLVFTNNSDSLTKISPSDVLPTTIDAEKKIVSYDGSSFSKDKINESANGTDYVVMTTSHPLYSAYIQNTANATLSTALVNEFERIKQFNSSLLEVDKQQDLSSNDIMQFKNDDKYLVGKNSTGSKLFMRVSDTQNIQVTTSDSTSSVVLHNGEQNAIMIPIVFQYRMVDGIGRINGDSTLSLSASNVEYKKKMGIDLVVGNELFKFDIVVNSKFRQTTLSASSSSNNSVINSIDPSSSNSANIV